MHMNNRNDENTNCERDRERVRLRIYINMYDDGLERSEFKLNWTNERTIKRTNERSKERTQNGNQNYWARVFCIDTVIHSTFLFKLVGLFVDGNVFSFDLICGYSVVVCVTHFLRLSLANSFYLNPNELNGKRAHAKPFSMTALALHLLRNAYIRFGVCTVHSLSSIIMFVVSRSERTSEQDRA